MKSLRLPHILTCGFLAVVFAAMAIEATTFEESAQWFPLYTAIGGAVLAATACLLGVAYQLRHRFAEPPSTEERYTGEDAPQSAVQDNPSGLADESRPVVTRTSIASQERRTVARGYGWLGLWLGFILMAMAVGYVAASLLWVAVWYRTIHKISLRAYIAVLLGVLLFLYVAQNELGMAMPGGDGWIPLGLYLR